MKRIRRIKQMYKASRLTGVKKTEAVEHKGKYYIAKRFHIDEYGRGSGYYYYVARDYGRRFKRMPVAFGDRSLEWCMRWIGGDVVE